MIDTQGSSALASFYSLQGLFNTVQIFALLLSTIGGRYFVSFPSASLLTCARAVPPLNRNASSDWRFVFLGKMSVLREYRYTHATDSFLARIYWL